VAAGPSNAFTKSKQCSTGSLYCRGGAEAGQVEARFEARALELRASELAMVLDGIDVSKLQRVARYERAV
jgi:hypothetical protein